MEISREDLLKQKAALEQQLQLVNHLLAQSGADEADAPPASPLRTTTSQQPVSGPPGILPAPAAPHTPSASGDGPSPLYAPETPPKDLGTFSTGQKIGCLAIGIGICIGILFAFFVLPYLIY
ncbi:hypothetical protein H5P28_14005 [Ruficoccus amylovorans]|uniref:Uncharacterized protein n=1 Tax=Ruficoccus amylovorans TaxID=1804625 RepID=A0A842HIN2_9BACT|nr:hypothetical protein [Ruficoccus amylovorans]MBC2595377.1 hypothetical protein [Ruficoccus amylovorans]